MSDLVFAANWKMHHGPDAARALAQAVLAGATPRPGRLLLFFPPAVNSPERPISVIASVSFLFGV